MVSPLYREHGFCANDGSISIMAGSGDDTFPVATVLPLSLPKRGTGHKAIDAGRDANAAFIVRAANCHHDLLEALKMALADIEMEGASTTERFAKMQAAISKAEGR